jgi:hypothetical protein
MHVINQDANNFQMGSILQPKSRREVSPVEQFTIDCEYLAYFLPKRNLKNLKKKLTL